MRLRTKAYKNKKTSKRVYKTKFSFNESPSKSIKKTFTKEETKDYTGGKNYQKRAISLYQKSLSIDIRRDMMFMSEFDFSFINKLKDISNKFEVSKSIFENIWATVEYKKDIIAVLAKGLCEVYIKDSAYHKSKSIDISNENFENNSDSLNNDEVTDKWTLLNNNHDKDEVIIYYINYY